MLRRGCICCEGCQNHLINKQGLVVPCQNKWSCDIYSAAYNKEKDLRRWAAEERRVEAMAIQDSITRAQRARKRRNK